MGKRLTRSKLFLSTEELAKLDRAAASLGVSRHKFMVDAATERASVALAAHVLPSLGNRDYQDNQVPFTGPEATESAS